MRYFITLFLILSWLPTTWADDPPVVPIPFAIEAFQPEWYTVESEENLKIHLYFFWTKSCPHCRAAKPFIDQLPTVYPWLTLHSYELSEHEENVYLYADIAKSIHERASSVPAFIFCKQMQTGYGSEQDTGVFLKQQLEQCYQQQREILSAATIAKTQTTTPVEVKTEKTTTSLHLPWLGEIDPQQYSLPIYTVVIAGLDAFNPCAFFVLLFLLSLLVHTRKRSRMLLIGGIFVFFSGFIYFLFMAAWLNIFKYIGELKIITVIAGLVALSVAVINIKDFFWFKAGISLSIPEGVKPSLYQRMRGLVQSTKTAQLVLSTITLAIVANAYELLCTAGFPMVYTRILTLNQLSDSTYYFYLVLYNIIYVIPLLVIVLIFTYTLGSRKLAESEGRILKLVSGLMMLGLGGILLFAPELLTNLFAAASVLIAAIGITVLIAFIEKRKGN